MRLVFALLCALVFAARGARGILVPGEPPREDIKGCTVLARGLEISEVALFQAPKILLASNGSEAQPRFETPIIADKPGKLRVYVTPSPEWVPRPIAARIEFRHEGGEAAFSDVEFLAAVPSDDVETRSLFEVDLPSPFPNFYRVTLLETASSNDLTGFAGPLGQWPPNYGWQSITTQRHNNASRLLIRIVPYFTGSPPQLPDTSPELMALHIESIRNLYPLLEVEFEILAPRTSEAFPPGTLVTDQNLFYAEFVRDVDELPLQPTVIYAAIQPVGPGERTSLLGQAFLVPPTLERARTMHIVALSPFYDVPATIFDRATMAHEVAHTHNREHVDCGGAAGPDPEFPYPRGLAGVWSYDARTEQFLSPFTGELMGYCRPIAVSDYNYAFVFRSMTIIEQLYGDLAGPNLLGVAAPARTGTPERWCLYEDSQLGGCLDFSAETPPRGDPARAWFDGEARGFEARRIVAVSGLTVRTLLFVREPPRSLGSLSRIDLRNNGTATVLFYDTPPLIDPPSPPAIYPNAAPLGAAPPVSLRDTAAPSAPYDLCFRCADNSTACENFVDPSLPNASTPFSPTPPLVGATLLEQCSCEQDVPQRALFDEPVLCRSQVDSRLSLVLTSTHVRLLEIEPARVQDVVALLDSLELEADLGLRNGAQACAATSLSERIATQYVAGELVALPGAFAYVTLAVANDALVLVETSQPLMAPDTRVSSVLSISDTSFSYVVLGLGPVYMPPEAASYSVGFAVYDGTAWSIRRVLDTDGFVGVTRIVHSPLANASLATLESGAHEQLGSLLNSDFTFTTLDSIGARFGVRLFFQHAIAAPRLPGFLLPSLIYMNNGGGLIIVTQLFVNSEGSITGQQTLNALPVRHGLELFDARLTADNEMLYLSVRARDLANSTLLRTPSEGLIVVNVQSSSLRRVLQKCFDVDDPGLAETLLEETAPAGETLRVAASHVMSHHPPIGPRKHPWVVYAFVSQRVCVGTILDAQWVLIGAACLDHARPSLFSAQDIAVQYGALQQLGAVTPQKLIAASRCILDRELGVAMLGLDVLLPLEDESLSPIELGDDPTAGEAVFESSLNLKTALSEFQAAFSSFGVGFHTDTAQDQPDVSTRWGLVEPACQPDDDDAAFFCASFEKACTGFVGAPLLATASEENARPRLVGVVTQLYDVSCEREISSTRSGLVRARRVSTLLDFLERRFDPTLDFVPVANTPLQQIAPPLGKDLLLLGENLQTPEAHALARFDGATLRVYRSYVTSTNEEAPPVCPCVGAIDACGVCNGDGTTCGRRDQCTGVFCRQCSCDVASGVPLPAGGGGPQLCEFHAYTPRPLLVAVYRRVLQVFDDTRIVARYRLADESLEFSSACTAAEKRLSSRHGRVLRGFVGVFSEAHVGYVEVDLRFDVLGEPVLFARPEDVYFQEFLVGAAAPGRLLILASSPTFDLASGEPAVPLYYSVNLETHELVVYSLPSNYAGYHTSVLNYGGSYQFAWLVTPPNLATGALFAIVPQFFFEPFFLGFVDAAGGRTSTSVINGAGIGISEMGERVHIVFTNDNIIDGDQNAFRYAIVNAGLGGPVLPAVVVESFVGVDSRVNITDIAYDDATSRLYVATRNLDSNVFSVFSFRLRRLPTPRFDPNGVIFADESDQEGILACPSVVAIRTPSRPADYTPLPFPDDRYVGRLIFLTARREEDVVRRVRLSGLDGVVFTLRQADDCSEAPCNCTERVSSVPSAIEFLERH